MAELKYAVIERERRFLVHAVPDGVRQVVEIDDYYIDGTRLRLREMRSHDGKAVRKLGHKVRLGESPAEIACTSMYLSDSEWSLLRSLPAREVHKARHIIKRDGTLLAVDRLDDGTLLAEIDDGDAPPSPVPAWLDAIREMSHEEAWTGGALAQ